jgi:tetratricopeptide (TPR) repeat protein
MRDDTFGRLLKAGIGSIALCENKRAPCVEDDLGRLLHVSADSIQRYKAGHIPPAHNTVKLLAEQCVRRGLMGRSWVEQFLAAARYPFAERLSRQLFPEAAASRPERAHENLPPPTYCQFVMREQVFGDVLDGLRQRSAVVLIVGLGGSGKTSLAREVAARCLSGDPGAPAFEAAVWVSDEGQRGALNLSVLLDEAAQTLGYAGLTQCPHREKLYEVNTLLRRQRVLVVVDNFETVTDGAVLDWLLRLPEPSKAIVTTREYRREFRSSWPVELRGMSRDEALQLTGQRLEALRLARLVADPAQLDPLLAATGGNPKAIELTLGLIKYERRSLQEVVDDLCGARGQLFNDLFERAWPLLDEAARRVLLAMVLFPDSASAAALGATADVPALALGRALERLTDMALLDGQHAALTSAAHYTLHPLVRAFATAQIAREPEFQRRAHQRWSAYLFELASASIVREYPRDRYWNTLPNAGMDRLDAEQANLLRVLAWAEQEQEQRLLLELTILMMHYMERRGLYAQREHYTRRSIAAAQALGKPKDEVLLQIDALGWLLTEQDRLTEAHAAIEAGLALLPALPPDDPDLDDLLALGLVFLARVKLYQGQTTAAHELVERALPIACSSPIRYRVTWIAGEVALAAGDYDASLGYYALMLRAGDEYGGEHGTRIDVGFVHLARGNIERAVAVFRETLHACPTEGVVHAIQATYGLAVAAQLEGALESARILAREALDRVACRQIQHRVVGQIRQLIEQLG